ncbi:ATP-binding protein [Planctomycetota bacterium]|nr:ATP-binding protein [Planctomycetota bacterium]
MAHIQNPPNAYNQIKSLRSAGYELETAIADLVDNSIAAQASKVNITLFWDKEGYHWLAIRDDGVGFQSQEEQLEALRLGSELRREDDSLGKFGYGLKTASLSIGKRLTVVNCQNGSKDALVLDLETQIVHPHTNQDKCFEEEAEIIKEHNLLPDSGALVLISHIDSWFSDYGHGVERPDVIAKAERVKEHLGLVFHRYIEKGILEIRISLDSQGGAAVKPWNPFDDKFVQTPNPDEWLFKSGVEDIPVKGYVCKHSSKFPSEAEHAKAGGPHGWLESQGFYVYRSDRVVVHGGWLGLRNRGRLIQKEPRHQLVRIKLDLPKSLDDHWKLDFMKTKVTAPKIEIQKLEDETNLVLQKGRSVYSNRAIVIRPDQVRYANIVRPWTREQNTRGEVKYKINKDYPFVLKLFNLLGAERDKNFFKKFLKNLGEQLPVNQIKHDIGEENKVARNASYSPEILDALMNTGLSEDQAMRKYEELMNYEQ